MKTKIAREDFRNQSYSFSKRVFGKNAFKISSILVCEKLDTLLAVDSKSVLVQYDLSTCKVLRNYGNLKIRKVFSNVRIGHLVFFGGNHGQVRVLRLDTREVLGQPVQTSIGVIFSMNLCIVGERYKERSIVLVVSGLFPNYLGYETDIFDVTGLVSSSGVSLKDTDFEVDQRGNIDLRMI